MQEVSVLICICCCLHIIYYDWKERLVSIIPLVILAGVGVLNITIGDSTKEAGFFVLINICFLIVNGSLTILYLKFKNKRKKKTDLDSYIGLGDILLMSALTLFFDPMGYALFYCGALIFSLLWFAIVLKEKLKMSKLPLAAGICLFFLVICIINYAIGASIPITFTR